MDEKKVRGKGLAISTAYSFDEEKSSMVHEQLARLNFAKLNIEMDGMKILDFGCGTGYNSYYIARHQSPELVIGIDILSECIEYCKMHYSTNITKYYVQDCLIHNQSFGLFDLVISTEVIEHVSDQHKFIQSLSRYMNSTGIAFISTPNKGVFSLGKEKSFLNHTHVKELYFKEFSDLLRSSFSSFKLYSQIHKPEWHAAYVNYLCVFNFVHALRYEIFGNNWRGQIAAKIGRHLLNIPLFKIKSGSYPDVRNRRYSDFDFVEGYHEQAVWFVAICHNTLGEI